MEGRVPALLAQNPPLVSKGNHQKAHREVKDMLAASSHTMPPLRRDARTLQGVRLRDLAEGEQETVVTEEKLHDW